MRPCTRRIASAEEIIKATSLDDPLVEHAPWCRTAPDALPIHIKPLMPRAADEPVRLTRIYTRGGDAGETSLGDGSRVSKLDRRLAAFGTVDELNSQIGFVLAGDIPGDFRPWLERVQNDLFDVGADLSVPFAAGDRLRIT